MQVLLPQMVVAVVRGSPRIHVHANERERECVAKRRTTSARSYAPDQILGPCVTREGIVVGRERVSEWALSSLSL